MTLNGINSQLRHLYTFTHTQRWQTSRANRTFSPSEKKRKNNIAQDQTRHLYTWLLCKVYELIKIMYHYLLLLLPSMATASISVAKVVAVAIHVKRAGIQTNQPHKQINIKKFYFIFSTNKIFEIHGYMFFSWKCGSFIWERNLVFCSKCLKTWKILFFATFKVYFELSK